MSLMGPLILMFQTSGDVSSGFQSQSEQPYLHLVEVYVHAYFTSIFPHSIIYT